MYVKSHLFCVLVFKINDIQNEAWGLIYEISQ